jgi:dimethylargininase
MFRSAIVRPPGSNFAKGLTTSKLGSPDYHRALEQHAAYCNALIQCGLTVTHLERDERHPDSTFVEDTAVLVNDQDLKQPFAVLARPGASSRTGEVVTVGEALRNLFSTVHSICEPGSLDGGDVCQVDNQFFVGLSARTNVAGATQLAEILEASGFEVSTIDIRKEQGLLHLKSGLAFLGDKRLVVTETIAERAKFSDYDLIRVRSDEEYAANCIRVNDYVLIASGFPDFAGQLRDLGYSTIELDMTEFQKMDGGLSCLSLRF